MINAVDRAADLVTSIPGEYGREKWLGTLVHELGRFLTGLEGWRYSWKTKELVVNGWYWIAWSDGSMTVSRWVGSGFDSVVSVAGPSGFIQQQRHPEALMALPSHPKEEHRP